MIIGDEFTITIVDGKIYPIIKLKLHKVNMILSINIIVMKLEKYLCNYDLGAIQPQIEALALRGYHGVGASGVARSDFMINRDGQIYF